jgi:leucyl aminopeptidase (aminopeptidase T)
MPSVELLASTYRVMDSYLGVQSGERVLIIADTRTSPTLPEALAGQAYALGGDPTVAIMVPRPRSGEEPPPQIAAAMLRSDVVVSVATMSMYHTEAKGAAQRAGVRGAFNAPSDEDAWIQGAMSADFVQIRAVAERLARRWRRAKTVRVTSPAGTDVTMSVAGREPKGWLTGICRKPGEVSAYPGGEVSLPPVEGTACGRIIFERVMTDIGALSSPIVLTVERGHVVAIDGGAEARMLQAHIAGVANATNIAEIGIGLNPVARLTADITEAKKRLGTAHIALGDSAGEYGGSVVSAVHLDGMILDCRVEMDGDVVVEQGEVKV